MSDLNFAVQIVGHPNANNFLKLISDINIPVAELLKLDTDFITLLLEHVNEVANLLKNSDVSSQNSSHPLLAKFSFLANTSTSTDNKFSEKTESAHYTYEQFFSLSLEQLKMILKDITSEKAREILGSANTHQNVTKF